MTLERKEYLKQDPQNPNHYRKKDTLTISKFYTLFRKRHKNDKQ